VPTVRAEQTHRTESAFKRRSRRALACGVPRIARSIRRSRQSMTTLTANTLSIVSLSIRFPSADVGNTRQQDRDRRDV
jgi:hypothetical protein